MQVSVLYPSLDSEFRSRLHTAHLKNSKASVRQNGDGVYVEVRSNVPYNGHFRVLGKYWFEVEQDICTLERRQTIEKEYYPFELAIEALTEYFKKSEVKYIAFN